jgi:hypothetical protein
MTTSATRMTAPLAVLLALGALAGCSASKSSGTPSVQSLAKSAAAAGLPTSTAGEGNNGSIDAKVCAAIQADVQALTKNVSSPATFPGQCAFDGGATTVTYDLDNPGHSDVTDVISTGANTISGIGDGAVWFDSDGAIVPSLGAWKGNITCIVQPDSDIADDTVPYTGTPPFTKISAADGAAYARKMGKVCTDVFAAAS